MNFWQVLFGFLFDISSIGVLIWKENLLLFRHCFFFHVKTSPRGGARLFCSRWFSSSHRPILRLHSIEWLFKGGGGLLRSLFANHFSLFCLLVFTSRRYLLYVHYYTRWSKCIQLMASWCMDWAVRFGSLPLFISVAFALYGLDGYFKRSRGTERKQFELGCCEGTKRHCRHMIRLFGGGSWTWISLKRWFNADLCVWDSTLELLRFLASARSSLAS